MQVVCAQSHSILYVKSLLKPVDWISNDSRVLRPRSPVRWS